MRQSNFDEIIIKFKKIVPNITVYNTGHFGNQRGAKMSFPLRVNTVISLY
jgi:hypothetical protein